MGVLEPLDATFASLQDIPVVKPTVTKSGYKGWYNIHWKNKGPFKYESDSNRDLLTDEKSVQWIVNKIEEFDALDNNQPFFMALGLIRPHTPLVVPQKYFDMFPLEKVQIPVLLENDKADTYYRFGTNKQLRGRKAFRALTSSYSTVELALRAYTQAYLASVAFTDNMVGQAINALDQTSLGQHTMVVLFSDHGYNLGEKIICLNIHFGKVQMCIDYKASPL